MPLSTNPLVTSTRKTIATTGVFATAVLGGVLLFHSNAVHAASAAVGPLDDSAITSLTALDQAGRERSRPRHARSRRMSR